VDGDREAPDWSKFDVIIASPRGRPQNALKGLS